MALVPEPRPLLLTTKRTQLLLTLALDPDLRVLCFEFLFCVLLALGVERRQTDSLPGRPGTGEKKLFLTNRDSRLPENVACLGGLGDARSWATVLGPALDQFIVDS